MKKVSSVSKILLLLLLLLFLRSQICDLRSKKFFLRNFHFKVSNAKKIRNTHPPLSPPKKLLVLFLHEGGGKGGVVTPLLSPPVVSQNAISHTPNYVKTTVGKSTTLL